MLEYDAKRNQYCSELVFPLLTPAQFYSDAHADHATKRSAELPHRIHLHSGLLIPEIINSRSQTNHKAIANLPLIDDTDINMVPAFVMQIFFNGNKRTIYFAAVLTL